MNEKFKQLLDEKGGLDVRELAIMSDITQDTIYQILRGRKTCHKRTIRKLANALEIEYDVMKLIIKQLPIDETSE